MVRSHANVYPGARGREREGPSSRGLGLFPELHRDVMALAVGRPGGVPGDISSPSPSPGPLCWLLGAGEECVCQAALESDGLGVQTGFSVSTVRRWAGCVTSLTPIPKCDDSQ